MNDINLKEDVEHGTAFLPIDFIDCYPQTETIFVPLHWHHEIEFLFLEKGTFTIQHNMDTSIINSPQLLIFNSGELHHIYTKDLGCRHCTIVFNPNMLSFEHFDYSQKELINPLLTGEYQLPNFINLNTVTGQNIQNEFLEAMQVIRNQKYGWYVHSKACILKMIAIMMEENLIIHNPISFKKLDNYKLITIKKVINYIEKNYAGKIYIDTLAKEINMNTQYFCRFFKKITGKQPIEYINRYRIEKATSMLADNNLKIIDIAFNSGFENYSYFIRKFREYKGCTPAKYRNTYLNKNDL